MATDLVSRALHGPEPGSPIPALLPCCLPPPCSASRPSASLPQGLCTCCLHHLGPLLRDAASDHTVKSLPAPSLFHSLHFLVTLNILSEVLLYPFVC